jgi:hypothetical protein
MVLVFMPVLKLTLGAASPLHQSHADLPGLIHDVSAIFDGGFRLSTMFDSISLPGSSAIKSTRHGEFAGAGVSTAMLASSTCGDSSLRNANAPGAFFRYIPA